MIVLDGPAFFAVLLGEPASDQCRAALEEADQLLLSAGSLTEALVAAAGKGCLEQMRGFLAALDPTIVPVTEDRARAAAEAYTRYGKGFHRAALNFGDSFAYALAKEHDCPLLFVGNDFAQTDVKRAIG
jgi:ribonuclease VapC